MEAGDGKAAIDLLNSRMDEIGVILLDTTVPGTSSREISEEALRLRPDVRVVLTSAYSRETAMALVDGPHVRGYIRKPFLLGDLLQLLRDTWPAEAGRCSSASENSSHTEVGGLFMSASGWLRLGKFFEKTLGGRRDFLDGCFERGLVRLRRFMKAAHFTHELASGG